MPEQPQNGSIELGDVGFIETSAYPVQVCPRVLPGSLTQAGSGAFTRLFNIAKSPEDPLNSRGVPEGFVQLDMDRLLKAEQERFLRSGPIASESVQVATIQPHQ